jgi:hypothetical protein
MTLNYDLSGNDLIVNSISTGAASGGTGTTFPAAANITTTNTAQTVSAVKTFSANPALTVGNTIKSNVAATTLTSNAATVTSYFLQCTTPSLSTAAGASQAEVITLTGLAATDLVFLTPAGGVNTVQDYNMVAVCTTNTLTVTIYNTGPTAALNGTIIFNVMILKA